MILKKRWLIFLILISLAAPVFAGGANVYITVKDHSNNNIGSGKFAACYDGSISVGPSGVSGTPSPNAPDGPNVGGRVFTNSSSYISDAADGGNELFDGRANKTVNIVACEGASISSVISAKGYYGYTSYQTSTTTSTPNEVNKTLTCRYKADVPPKPTASAGSYSLSWNSDQRQYLVSFSVSASEGKAYNTEYNSGGWKLQVVRAGDDWSTGKTYNAKSKTVVETNPAAPYFVAGGAYQVRAQAANNFGTSDWGDPANFSIPTGGAAGGGTFTFNLKASQTDELIVNSIALPANALSDATVSNVSELSSYINSQAGKNIVTSISKWDPETGNAVGATFNDGGDLVEGEDFAIIPGVGYQVFTNDDLTITFSGM